MEIKTDASYSLDTLRGKMFAVTLCMLFNLVSSQYPSASTITNTKVNITTNNTVVRPGRPNGFPMMPQFPVHHPNVVHFIGAGYNLLKGNPDGESWSSVGDDPGLKITQKMLFVAQGNTPPQIEIEHRDSCQASHSYNLIYNTKAYQNRLMSAITTSGETDAALKPYAFTLSTGYNAVVHQLSPPLNYVFQDYTTECDMGHARLRTHLAASDHMSVSREFASAVCELPVNYQSPNYMKFIEEWGTHMITEVEVGKKITYRYQTTLDKYFSYLLTNASQDIKRSIGSNGHGDVLKVDLDIFKYRVEYRYLAGKFHDSFGVGNPQYNDEIEMSMVTIDGLLDNKYWSYMSYLIQQGVCGHDAPSSLAKWRANLITALKYYPTYNSAKLPVDGALEIPLVWPTGVYSLQKPLSGCPGVFSWSEGHVTINGSGAQASHMSTFDGDIEHTSYTLNYCTKERNESPYELTWPKGDYCIFKHDSECPDGFTSSSIRYRDGHHPKLVGVTPYTSYTITGTQYWYCCRSDSSYLTPIYMPTSKPFYMLKNKHGCQRVDGMVVKEHYYLYPTSHSLFVHNPPAHSSIKGKGVQLDYCYYEAKKISSVIG